MTRNLPRQPEDMPTIAEAVAALQGLDPLGSGEDLHRALTTLAQLRWVTDETMVALRKLRMAQVNAARLWVVPGAPALTVLTEWLTAERDATYQDPPADQPIRRRALQDVLDFIAHQVGEATVTPS